MVLYITETLGVVFTMLESTFPNPLTKYLYGVMGYFEYINFMFMREIGIVTFKDETPTFLDRPRVLYEEAKKRGYGMQKLTMIDKDLDYYYVTFPNKVELFFRGLPKVLLQPAKNDGWVDDKLLFKQKAKAAGIPVSEGSSCWSLHEAEKIFAELKKPVIVKPRQGSRGRHTTTWIQTIDELRVAFKSAQQLCACVMVEEMLTGSVYRGTVVDGNVTGVLAGDPPRITGDGTKTVKELVEIKNATKPEKVSDVIIDEKLEGFIGRSGNTLDTILLSGKTIDLSEKIGLAYGGDARNVTNQTHPKIIEYVRRAGELVGDPILGFDFIVPDISADPDTQHWGFIECNGLPFINLHHDPRIGESINVAGKVWDYVEKQIATKPRKKLWICL